MFNICVKYPHLSLGSLGRPWVRSVIWTISTYFTVFAEAPESIAMVNGISRSKEKTHGTLKYLPLQKRRQLRRFRTHLLSLYLVPVVRSRILPILFGNDVQRGEPF